ncbi:MAG: hypothetical protein K6C99_01030 [Lachnospiraceae bacterium]|nr:hypothetical protein [Lachnospiraceae bacterium]
MKKDLNYDNKNGHKGNICVFAARFMLAVLAVVICLMIPEPADKAGAVSISVNGDEKGMIKNSDREAAYVVLIEYMNNLKRKDLSAAQKAELDEIMYDANVFIANTEMTVNQLGTYEVMVKERMDSAASKTVPGANKFLFIDNTSAITSAKYDEQTSLTLSVVNLGDTSVSDVVITPVVDTSKSKWPFVIQTASDARVIDNISPAKSIEQSVGLAKQETWYFVVSSDAKTGVYPITFHAIYYRNGEVEEADLKTYINITGKPSSGKLEKDEDEKPTEELKTSTPRIIVTGFTTDPATVMAGDTFDLTVTVKNTSDKTAVSNIQFDFKAAQEGNEKETTYEAFLPTSGSATLYVDRIGPGETTDLSIEMTARADLTQKPYVINLDMAYEDNKHNPYTAQSNVSIPVKQEARVDSGDVEITPEMVEVGQSVNVMFPVYNKGKTILYNVQVEFVSDSFTGGSTFLGKLEPGATGSVDAMLDAVAATEDDGTVKAVISYEDEAGVVTEVEKDLTIYVSDAYGGDSMAMPEIDEDGDGIMDGMDYDGDGIIDEYYEPQKKSFSIPWWIWLIAGLFGFAVIIVVIVIIVVSRKKRLAAELAKLDDEE